MKPVKAMWAGYCTERSNRLSAESIPLVLVGLFLLTLALTGCICDSPNEDTDMPWNPAIERDAMIPLPNSMMNRYN